MENSLELFHPLTRAWFAGRYGAPTDVQAKSWPEIAAGSHVLITAPTGSGKTLTAFLWALDKLATGAWEPGRTAVLYVSPLKALNNDIQRNLLRPLSELRAVFERAGEPFPDISVLTRSGDTEPAERRRMLSHPPEILITTPESLNIMLTSRKSRGVFTGVTTVILDEIHSVAGNKRGTHLITAVDRLVPLAGEFQRIALSATVKPLEVVADFVGGRVMQGEAGYRKRNVTVVQSIHSKQYDVAVHTPPDGPDLTKGTRWPELVKEFKKIIRRNKSTLMFTNSRRLCERISLMINEDKEKPVAYSHHGSLSRETRVVVEQRLKRGELAAIVATTSLELGIDVGALDEVVLVETPPSVSSAVQRIGRAGHNVGEISRGMLFPTYGIDFLNAAVMSRTIVEQDIESVRPIANPLDVLAQVIVSMTATETWDIDRLYAFVRTSYPYRDLSRGHFDLVLNMLAGRYSDTRIRELKPLVSVDRIDNTVAAREYASRRIYLSGGTIPDRGYFTLRLEGSGARIGELDEEFVWESSVGGSLTLGAQTWKIRRIDHNDVTVVPGDPAASAAPFWRAEALNRDYHLSERITEFLEEADAALDDPQFLRRLETEYFMSEDAASALVRFLQRQKNLTRTALPHRHHVLAERCWDGSAGESNHVIIHTLWGGRVNRPFAMALSAAWEREHGSPLETIANNDAIAVMLVDDVSVKELLSLVRAGDLEELLRRELAHSGFFGARFRENAARALLLARKSFRMRMPLWLNRLRSKKLLEAVSQYDDFPIVLETWRTCLQDEFDVAALRQLLGELNTGEIKVTQVETIAPSPFAESIVWGLTNQYMYDDDVPRRGGGLDQDLVKELVLSPGLRPEIPNDLIGTFREKLHRTAPGYAPRTPVELLEWVKERLFIPEPEWQRLLQAVERDADAPAKDMIEPVADKLAKAGLHGCAPGGVVALENIPRLLDAFGLSPDDLACTGALSGESIAVDLPKMAPPAEVDETPEERDALADWLGEWLQFYGPVGEGSIRDVFGLSQARISDVLETLADARSIVIDRLSEGAEEAEICDCENLERLLRLARAAARPVFRPLHEKYLPLFIAAYQGLTERGDSLEHLQGALEKLFGYPAPAELWEKDILPARLSPYATAWMDSLMQQSGLVWFGRGRRRIALCLPHNIDLFMEDAEQTEEQGGPISDIIPSLAGRYSFASLLKQTNRSSAELTAGLWNAAWQGAVTNDSFVALRTAIENNFRPSEAPMRNRRRAGRGGLARWQASRPFAGNWYVLERPQPAADALERDELDKERARVLLDRYGILFRELIARELPALRWGSLFRALRLMELSGEVLAGCFFEGIGGLQFLSHDAWRRLQEPMPEDAIFRLNAADPASLCGAAPEGGDHLRSELPARLPTTHLVYHGAKLVMISKKQGKELEINAGPDDPRLPEYLAIFDEFLNRQFQPAKAITIETINGRPAHKSPYLQPLQALFNASADYKSVKLWKTF